MRGIDPGGKSGASGSAFSLALRCVCPNCGTGKLYNGLLAVKEKCDVCEFDLSSIDSGDGAAAFVVLLLGAIILPLVLVVEFRFHLPLWLQMGIWLPVILGSTILLLRPIKAWLIGQQFRHIAGGK